MAIHTLSIDNATSIRLEQKDIELQSGRLYRRFDLRVEDEDGSIFLISLNAPTVDDDKRDELTSIDDRREEK